MQFNSLTFLIFITIFFVFWPIVKRKTAWRLWYILAASAIFYGWWDWRFLFLILFTGTVDFFVSLGMNRTGKDWVRKLLLGISITAGIGTLAIFKYSGFIADSLTKTAAFFGINHNFSAHIPEFCLILPVGISFYTFQSLSYTIDVYRNNTKVQKNFFKLLLYVSFFPQLVQGPISRHSDLANQLYEPHKFDGVKVKFGLQRILWGFFKKLVIADRIAVAISALANTDNDYGGAYVFVLIIFYSIQIYADFTGGIDITIGIAEALGMKLAENFNRPFSSRSTKEYWNRWHMTMGNWFNDYIFMPLSVTKPLLKLSKAARSKNNRFMKGLGKRIPVYTATTVTWFTTGLWHGAKWNFIVWGMLNCLVILVSQELEPLYRRFRGRFPRLVASYPYHCFAVTRTFLLMGLIRSLDCYRNVSVTFASWGSMFTSFNWGEVFGGGLLGLGLDVVDYVIIVVAVLVLFTVSKLGEKRDIREALVGKTALSWTLTGLVLMAILLFGAYGIDFASIPSIYGQF